MLFEKLASNRYSRRGVFYYRMGKTVVKIDPLLAYVRLKEFGLDVMYEELKGALKGNDAKLKVFVKRVCGAFNVSPYDPTTDRGYTALDLIRLFEAYGRYLSGLKKNVTLLRDFAPGLEERLNDIFSDSPKASESTGESSLLDSTSTPPEPSPTPDSPTTTEQAERSTD